MLSAVEAALVRAAQRGSGGADELAAVLLRCTPVFSRWAEASAALDAADSAAEAAETTAQQDDAVLEAGGRSSAALLWD
jgi:hypothetical protein